MFPHGPRGPEVFTLTVGADGFLELSQTVEMGARKGHSTCSVTGGLSQVLQHVSVLALSCPYHCLLLDITWSKDAAFRHGWVADIFLHLA